MMFELATLRRAVAASLVGLVMALGAGLIYPAVVQALVVNPNQRDREAPYIERNVLATRQALGIDGVKQVSIDVGELTTQEVEDGTQSLQNVRLLKADSDMVTRYRSDEGLRAGLTINDLDVDRMVAHLRHPRMGRDAQRRQLDLIGRLNDLHRQEREDDSALDAQVRVQLREEIRRIQLELGITTVFVTHDQAEALSVADRVGVLRAGRLEQVASPDELYERPATAFVAEFVGTMNRVPAVLRDGEVQLLGTRRPVAGATPPEGAVVTLRMGRARLAS